jgi:hypothetical protein
MPKTADPNTNSGRETVKEKEVAGPHLTETSLTNSVNERKKKQVTADEKSKKGPDNKWNQ